jgi:hypothetical protein
MGRPRKTVSDCRFWPQLDRHRSVIATRRGPRENRASQPSAGLSRSSLVFEYGPGAQLSAGQFPENVGSIGHREAVDHGANLSVRGETQHLSGREDDERVLPAFRRLN